MEMCKKDITFAQNFENCAMNTASSFNEYVYQAIIKNWDADALTDYQGQTLQFHDVARKIEKLHILFENCNIRKGDKIAICGRNSAHWAVAFLATLTCGAVAVPVLHEFNAEQIHNIVNHSGARLLFVGDFIAKEIDPQEMPHLEGIVNLPDFSLMLSRSKELTYARENLNLMFGSKYPKAFRKEDVRYHTDTPEELALINYTSGTTGFSKGVMLPYRALLGNLEFCLHRLGNHVKAGAPMLDILPMAHMYGLAIEFVFGFCNGCHLFFLNRPEEIEDKLNSMAMVSESIVIQEGEKLMALVYPEQDDMVNFTQEELEAIMEQNRTELNKQLPHYCQLSHIKLHNEEFKKTPKKSIKRYLYQNI